MSRRRYDDSLEADRPPRGTNGAGCAGEKGSWVLCGGVVVGFEGGAWALKYEIRCDPSWATRSATDHGSCRKEGGFCPHHDKRGGTVVGERKRWDRRRRCGPRGSSSRLPQNGGEHDEIRKRRGRSYGTWWWTRAASSQTTPACGKPSLHLRDARLSPLVLRRQKRWGTMRPHENDDCL